MTVVLIEGKAAILIYFVKKSLTMRMHRLPKFVTERGPIQSMAITPHSAEMAIGRRSGLEWWTSFFFWVQETQDLIRQCKSANMFFQKYVDLRCSYALFKPKWHYWSCHDTSVRAPFVGFLVPPIEWQFFSLPVTVSVECHHHWGNTGLLVTIFSQLSVHPWLKSHVLNTG